ncbi:MAG: bifunctional transaldolase/phosoglucose isomerase, partial [Actinomycetota bacterium]
MLAARWGPAGGAVDGALTEARAATVARIWQRDASLWSGDAAAQKAIRNRLGWLDAPRWAIEQLADLRALAADVRGFTRVVLLGMGGSSLAPEVLAATYGAAATRPLTVVDSTDPDEISAAAQGIDERTLFIVASKSGETIETRSHAAYFFDRVGSGDQFVAVTDPGSPLEKAAREGGFRHVFLNPPDIGGRYSALSFFGLVPATGIGLDVEPLLARAHDAAERCMEDGENRGFDLGVALGELARGGRDKVTFDASPRFASFGAWAEQLLAESTGKDGKGLIPVDGERLAGPEVYGDDRVFVRIVEPGWHADAGAPLAEAGHPVVTMTAKDAEDLGMLFFVWEFATAAAGWRLGVNPFDEPNVSESKQNTGRLIEAYEREGRLPEGTEAAAAEDLAAFVRGAKPGDYVAIQAFVPRNDATSAELTALRTVIRDRLRVATTVGFGPRFLHSTGQLHKGGPGTGLFVQITTDHAHDVKIPGAAYTFGVLQAAQAAGDLDSLQRHERRAIRLHLNDPVRGLRAVTEAVRDRLI